MAPQTLRRYLLQVLAFLYLGCFANSRAAVAWPSTLATGSTQASLKAFQRPIPKGVTFRGRHQHLHLRTRPRHHLQHRAPLAHALPNPTLASTRPPECKRLLWFIAVAQNADGSIPSMYEASMISAVMSALQNAPSLYPYLIFQGVPGSTDTPSVVQWFAAMGGTVLNHTLSFLGSLEESVEAGAHDRSWLSIQGTFLRIDLPLLLGANFAFPEDADREYVLYTDVDVMFEADIHSCTLERPRNMLMGAETQRGTTANAGVLYINMSSLAEHHEALIEWGHKRRWPQQADQTLLLQYFKGKRHGGLQHLPDEYNWKGYWGGPAEGDPQPVIIHFHGPKPMRCLECFILHSNQIDYCEARDPACKIYATLWRMAPDGGVYMARALQQFYMYLGLATSPLLR